VLGKAWRRWTSGFACACYCFRSGIHGEHDGLSIVHTRRIAVQALTLYDCASLTKPLITAHLIRKLGVDLERRVRFGPGVSRFPKGAPTILELMNHSSGMPGWLPLYLLAGTPREALRRLPALQEAAPGTRSVYSCPGYILLGWWLELETGLSLSDLAASHLIKPLKLGGEVFFPLPPDMPRERVAATELGNRIERAMCGGKGRRRPSPLWGEVHDGNAFFLGGAAGNAGLFATAGAVVRLARSAWPAQGSLPAPGSYWMGFKVGGGGTCFPAGSLGHNGFTGTSVCLHRKLRGVSVLLTNRLHRAHPRDIFPLRKGFHARAQRRMESRSIRPAEE
jgi:serine-type D-Ala-D-Ala carboxypeptidase